MIFSFLIKFYKGKNILFYMNSVSMIDNKFMKYIPQNNNMGILIYFFIFHNNFFKYFSKYNIGGFFINFTLAYRLRRFKVITLTLTFWLR
jgi:hypothetical protein